MLCYVVIIFFRFCAAATFELLSLVSGFKEQRFATVDRVEQKGF